MINFGSRTLFIISTSIVIHFEAIAQHKFPRLHIGDKIPDVKFSSVRNYSFSRKSLSDFKGKYIILDIWDKTCSACIAAMPHMEKLQEEFSSDLQVLLITKSKKTDLSVLFKNSKVLQSIQLPMILGDTMITVHFFPYSYLPKHIWINRDGKVVAITQGAEATDDNVSRMIRGEKLHLTTREDIIDEQEKAELDDQSMPLMFAVNSRYLTNLSYYCSHDNFKDSVIDYSLIMKRISGARDEYMKIIQDGEMNYKGVRFINTSLYNLFKFSYNYGPFYFAKSVNRLDSSITAYPGIPKIIVEKNVALLILKEPLKANISQHLQWEDQMSFCYDVRLANAVKDNNKFRANLRLQMQNDLEKGFGIKGVVEERRMKCFVLYRDSLKLNAYKESPNMDEKFYGKLFSNEPFWNVVVNIGNSFMDAEDPPLVNETGLYEERVTMDFRTDLSNLKQLQEDFGKYGIKVKEEMRNYQVLVLKKADL